MQKLFELLDKEDRFGELLETAKSIVRDVFSQTIQYNLDREKEAEEKMKASKDPDEARAYLSMLIGLALVNHTVVPLVVESMAYSMIMTTRGDMLSARTSGQELGKEMVALKRAMRKGRRIRITREEENVVKLYRKHKKEIQRAAQSQEQKQGGPYA